MARETAWLELRTLASLDDTSREMLATTTIITSTPRSSQQPRLLDLNKMSTERATREKTVSACQECKKATALYQCPSCSTRTCSLACCNSHKRRTKCTGKRNRTNYLPLAHMNDQTMQSDYHFLEDVLCQVNGGRRLLKSVGAAPSITQHNKKQLHVNDDMEEAESSTVHPILRIMNDDDNDDEDEPQAKKQKTQNNNKWQRLVQQAELRQVTLMLMPRGMQRNANNTTWHHYKTDTIHWKVDFVLHCQDDNKTARIVSIPKLDENTSLARALAPRIPELGSSEYHFLLKKLPCPSSHPLYVELDQESSLKSALRGQTVIEYPTIDVVPTAALSHFPRSIQEV